MVNYSKRLVHMGSTDEGLAGESSESLFLMVVYNATVVLEGIL